MYSSKYGPFCKKAREGRFKNETGEYGSSERVSVLRFLFCYRSSLFSLLSFFSVHFSQTAFSLEFNLQSFYHSGKEQQNFHINFSTCQGIVALDHVHISLNLTSFPQTFTFTANTLLIISFFSFFSKIY